jgi:malonyl-CoA O-methyltransferase
MHVQVTDNYNIDKARARASFGRAANTYDASAILQKQVREEMLSRLDLVNLTPLTILDAGCGTGLASHALQKRFVNSQVVSLDFSIPMLQKTHDTNPNNSLIGLVKNLFGGAKENLLCADIESLPLANASVGLVWSNLAIQWCNDLDVTLKEFHRVLQPEGLLMFSTFGPDTLKELRIATNSQTSVTNVNRFIDMHDIGDAMVRSGFCDPVLDVERFTLTYDDVISVMRDLKSIGAHNANDGRARGLLGRGFLRNIEASYEQFRQGPKNEGGKLPATFEVVYGHAWRGVDKQKFEDGSSPVTFRPRNKLTTEST